MNISHVWLRKDGKHLRVLVQGDDGHYYVALDERAGDLTQEELSHDRNLDAAGTILAPDPIDPQPLTWRTTE